MWKIYRINTETGDVTMRNEQGKTIDFTIPSEHRGHVERSAAHIRKVCDDHDSSVVAITVPDQPGNSWAVHILAVSVLCNVVILLVVAYLVERIAHGH